MTSWHIAFRTALREWDERSKPDDATRRALVLWLERLAINGPPLLYEMDETGRYCRSIAPTGNVVEYLVLRDKTGGSIGILVIRD